jgi:acyl-coenzyme A thioesterase PaaI-like protein
VTVAARWSIGERPNGGYLAALVTRALGAAAGPDHPDPLTVSVHYLRSPVPGPAEVHLEPLRAGRTVTTVARRLVQDGRPCLHLVAGFGDLAAAEGPSWVRLPPPAMLPPGDCAPADPRLADGVPMSFLDRVELRFDPSAPPSTGAGTGEVTAWARLAGGGPAGPLALMVLADALPPSVVTLGLPGWVPTLELTVHVRARPDQGEPGWLLVRATTRAMVDAHVVEDAEVWDERGTLVAQSRQLARVLTRPAP